MMEESEKQTLVRTKWNLLRTLDSINDMIDAEGVPVGNHMLIDDIKDCLKCVKYIHEMMAKEAEAAKVAAVK